MIRTYTTPYHHFILPFKREIIDCVYITYVQNGETIIEKDTSTSATLIGAAEVDNTIFGPDDVPVYEPTDSIITIHLTQEDTSKFTRYSAEEKNIALIQLRVVTTDGNVYASRMIRDRISGVLKKEIV